MADPTRILIVDDEPNIRSGLAIGLAKSADLIDTAGDFTEAIEKLRQAPYQIVITDVRLPGELNGLELVTFIAEQSPQTTILVITAHGTIETAVDAMRRGAFEFITKPFDLNLVREQVATALSRQHLQSRETGS